MKIIYWGGENIFGTMKFCGVVNILSFCNSNFNVGQSVHCFPSVQTVKLNENTIGAILIGYTYLTTADINGEIFSNVISPEMDLEA